MNLLSNAIRFAANAHANQLDKGGAPYILHPIRVMQCCGQFPIEVQAAAVLHDVMEDCGATHLDLQSIGIPDFTIKIVAQLTKGKKEPYDDYIGRLIKDRDFNVLTIKKYDLLDNLDHTRLASFTESDQRRMMRYASSYDRVKKALYELFKA